MKYHNPYAFIEATGNVNGAPAKTVSFADIVNGRDPYVRHDVWHQEAVSGRMLFCLETQSPTVIGKEQVGGENEASVVEPYTVKGEVAIPASSLRGLIGNNAEALSQSALRVMVDKNYSVRQSVGKTPAALGMLVKSDESESGWGIRPLIIPALASNHSSFKLPSEWQAVFGKRLVWRDHLAVYLDGYDKRSGRKFDFIGRAEPCSYTPDNKQYWYAQLSTNASHSDELDAEGDRNLKVKPPRNGKGKSFLIGQRFTTRSEQAIIAQSDYDALSQHEQRRYTRGVLRVLGREHDSIPNNKIHELFIPYPESAEHRQIQPIDKKVVANFIAIAKERHEVESHLPFRLQGHASESHQLNEGDLLYFSIDGDSNVMQLSVSQIWRQAVAGSTYNAFENISAGLPPLTKQRKYLTAAECLFGAVAEDKTEGDRQALHLASRVRFYDAKAFEKVELNDQTMLRILASPKAPSPAMYFHNANQSSSAIAKQQLDLTQTVQRPNGRKRYVPHRQHDIDNQFWTTPGGNDPHLRLKVKPIPEGQKFYFHVDVENISPAEFSLLSAAITPERFDTNFTGNYQHRLGLGKPLGLGHVTIKPIGVFLIDRSTRYQPTGLLQPRYQRCWLNDNIEWPDKLKSQYQLEWYSSEYFVVKGIPEYQDALVDANTLAQMLTLGDSMKVQHPVRYPFIGERSDAEQEGFEWFVENDKPRNRTQVLASVKHNMPSLDSTHSDNREASRSTYTKRPPSTKGGRAATFTGDNHGFVQGRVKFFNHDKGFGFIRLEASPDVYFSQWILKRCGYDNASLNTDDQVLIKSGPGKKGPEVKEIKLATE